MFAFDGLVRDTVAQPKSAAVILLFVFLAILWPAYSSKKSQQHLRQYPWVGVNRAQWFAILRGALQSFRHAAQFGLEGYSKFSKQGQLWVCVDHTGSPEIMMSPVHLEEALKIDSVLLDSHRHISKLLAEDYVFGGYGVALSVAAHETTLIRGVSKNLNAMTPSICDETAHALERHWGGSPGQSAGRCEWQEKRIMAACADVVGQITNRMLVGLPLCRDRTFLRRAKRWARLVLQTAWIIFMLPDFLKPLLGPLLAIPSILCHHRALQMVIPVAQERLERRKRRAEGVPGEEWEEPMDYMKFLLDEGSAGFHNVLDRDATTLARASFMVNAAAFHATALTLANLLLDIFSAPPSVADELRAEALAVQREHGLDNKLGLSKMAKLDSAIRESMRLHVLGIKAMHRYVKPQEGITFSNGDFVPCGAHLSLPVLGRHLDEALYANATQYDAFRFSREECADKQSQNAQEPPPKRSVRVKAAVNASPNHLAWGLGKSQCPGRFFAIDELKLIMAHILIYYEVAHIPERPRNIPISSQSIPPFTASIRFRPRPSP